jgi:hypothetical protein
VIQYAPPLAHRPETLARLRMRYPWAIDHAHDSALIAEGTVQHPVTDRVHVFDFFDGLRLTIFLETAQGIQDDGTVSSGLTFRHMSALVATLSPLGLEFAPDHLMPEALLELAEERYRDLSRDKDRPKLLGIANSGIPHWVTVLPEGVPK